MRTHYQRRSWTSTFIWTSALFSIVLVAAWQFQWWPTSETDLDEAPQARKPKSISPVQQASHEAKAKNADDLFATQSEPEFPEPPESPPFEPAERPELKEFPSPPDLLPANPDAKPIPVPSRLVQTVEGDLNPRSPRRPIDEEPQFRADQSIQLLGDEAPRPFEPMPMDVSPPGFEAVQEQIRQIDAWMASSDPKQELLAHKELSTMYWDHPEWREAIRERIETTAKSIYFSKQPHYMTPYTIQPGDQFTKIGKLYKVPWEYLAELNKVDPKKIRAGQKLKVIKGPFAAVVDLHRFELTIQHHGFFVKRYKVGIGKDGTTPIGEFVIKTKLVNPTYYGPDGLVIAADDPQNPLGEYWLDIGDSYGIHGTIEPDSIGKAESKGCIRMLNKEAAEVYGFLGTGAKVIIRR